MPDLLVKLYALPDPAPVLAAQAARGVVLRRPIGPEHRLVVDWVLREFGDAWASETEVALGNRPVTCWAAVAADQMVGFACHDATARGFFGPVGVSAPARGRGTGAALLLASLHDMRTAGYGYAVIGGAAAPDFYHRAVGAMEIPDSSPGLYRGMLRRPAPAGG
jgi:GNAT superfamily N-acetyltransferase